MKTLIYRIALLLLAICLAACAIAPRSQDFVQGGADYFPGGSPDYAFGQGQSFENFENVVRAQSYLGLFTKYRSWIDIKPNKTHGANIIGLRGYLPIDVRWKLKDGREFILEQIDLRTIMREYFKTHDIQLQHQEENRARAQGDFSPDLLHEVKDDTVVIKWQVTTNLTPLAVRNAPATKARGYGYKEKEYFVTAIKGKPTSGIDFEKWAS